jgi:hydroxyacylglutathione hydrolase
MLSISTIVVTPFMQNARILTCTDTKVTVVVDPGGEPDRIISELHSRDLSCSQIWLTHSHLDHCGGVLPLLESLGVPLVAHPAEEAMRARVRSIAQMYGLPSSEWFDCPEPSVSIRGGEILPLGDLRAQVLFTPGHSPGHVSFYFESEKVLISGDALFAGSIGRTDLPGGDHSTLIKSIREKILTLDDDVRVLSGHGDDTTVGEERRNNPFLA